MEFLCVTVPIPFRYGGGPFRPPPKRKQLMHLILLNKHVLTLDDISNLGLRHLLVSFDFNFVGVYPPKSHRKNFWEPENMKLDPRDPL